MPKQSPVMIHESAVLESAYLAGKISALQDYFAGLVRRKHGGWTRIRTGDTRIFSPLLYQLSYPATFCHVARACIQRRDRNFDKTKSQTRYIFRISGSSNRVWMRWVGKWVILFDGAS
jgi:hypothetical protein